MNKWKLNKKRYEVYRKALHNIGIELKSLMRPTKRSIENAKKLWRMYKAKLKDVGIELGPVDDFAKRKSTSRTAELTAMTKISNIMALVREGLDYTSTKGNQAGAIMVNNSAQRIDEIIQQSLAKNGYEETARLLEEWAIGSDLKSRIERMILAVYDSEYARWAHGAEAYEREIASLCNALGVEDTMGLLFA